MPTSLDVERVRTAVLGPTSRWTRIDLVQETGSTNADLVAGARAGALTDGTVLVSELQVSGRGRLGRSWQAPPGKALTFSVLLDPGVPAPRWGWLPLLTGVALADAVASSTGVQAALKWPNDLLAPDGRKLAGILSERVETPNGPRAVVGIGLNVSQAAEELPVTTATSIHLTTDEDPERADLLVAILEELAVRLRSWAAADGSADGGPDPLRGAYLTRSASVGTQVRVQLPGQQELLGTAVDIDAAGRLVVARGAGDHVAVAAGDVIHLR